MPSIFTTSQPGEKPYTKLLNNLLDIKGRDQTIFTRVNGVDTFDVIGKFGLNYAQKMLQQDSFTLALTERDLTRLSDDVKNAAKGKEVIEAYNQCKEKLFNVKKLQLENPATFESTRTSLVEELNLKMQKTNARWSQFRRKIIDTNMQENVWPLHVATCFVSLKTARREVYAPFLLREVTADVSESTLTLRSFADDNWKINEKLVFMLNDAGFTFDEGTNLKELTTQACLDLVNGKFNSQMVVEDLLHTFVNKKTSEIKNQTLEFHPGVVLGIFKPAGGHLRKTMLSIIENDEVDTIIDVKPDKTSYEHRLKKFLEQDSQSMLRIQPANYSQDKALGSALVQDTIIWGPPGTGKSQVIANLIANILYRNKTAVVVSQKKAALDVLKKRLGKVAPFALFILNDNKMVKAEFYKPLQQFVRLVENAQASARPQSQKLITSAEIATLNAINAAKTTGEYTPALAIIEQFAGDVKTIQLFLGLDKNLQYPTGPHDDAKVYTKKLALANHISKRGWAFFIQWYPKYVRDLATRACIVLNRTTADINAMKAYIGQAQFATVAALLDAPQTLKRQAHYQSNEADLVATLSRNLITKVTSWDRTHQQNYKRFANAVRAGRRLPYKFMHDHMSIIRELFPVIVTTPETTFVNWERNSFDYAVLDESSQMFLEIGLPVLYLAKTKVLAGDSQQMQPSRWFATRDDTDDTTEDVAENAASLLDYALDKGVYQVMLNKNYRSSAAALMAFSAKQFYDSDLEVIDNFEQTATQAIDVLNVEGKWENGTNAVEAQRVIELTLDYLQQYPSIIILTFNSAQRQLIEKIILETYPRLVQALEDEHLAVRNIENIQGDEADLVIASVVYDATTNTSGTYVARPGGKNALNVAISRARNRMIVVKSVTATTIKPARSVDFATFRAWLEFLDLPEDKKRCYSQKHYHPDESYGETESTFERDVVDHIRTHVNLGEKTRLIKQYPVGSKRIDIAILNLKNEFLLGIEVDGYKYHGGMGFDKYLEDFSRQEFLEAKGYPIFRVTEIDWRTNKGDVTASIQRTIKDIIFKRNKPAKIHYTPPTSGRSTTDEFTIARDFFI